jgi:hypothetical protein
MILITHYEFVFSIRLRLRIDKIHSAFWIHVIRNDRLDHFFLLIFSTIDKVHIILNTNLLLLWLCGHIFFEFAKPYLQISYVKQIKKLIVFKFYFILSGKSSIASPIWVANARVRNLPLVDQIFILTSLQNILFYTYMTFVPRRQMSCMDNVEQFVRCYMVVYNIIFWTSIFPIY